MFRYLGSLGAIILLTSYQDIIDWISHHLLTCPFKKVFLIDCPGCGLQRSIVALLRGDFNESWHMYPATLPMLLLIGFVLVNSRINFRYGSWIVKILSGIVFLIIISSYILKIKNHQLF
ncbi:DUF2752 domain-containing protein [Cytophagaceae bacterium YF14B1]|uniref:DUF2752 domain-containing protein n=1 Tax=Xanthocytophaga flava TaxID=3048013 RepID=A0AAE3U473_9BACT|nr:DUF2752 domain-containing protein [Xanthocytophaga flavus]MDJ1479489.1 DUF2752 domain-containing protein [Xanthocytophaga flavus]